MSLQEGCDRGVHHACMNPMGRSCPGHGVPDGTGVRADAQPRLPNYPLWQQALDRASEWLVCPGCLGFRFGLTHLVTRWLGGRH